MFRVLTLGSTIKGTGGATGPAVDSFLDGVLEDSAPALALYKGAC